MKRFLIAVIGIASVLLALWLCTFYFGFYIDFQPNRPPEALFFSKDGELLHRTSDGRAETVSVRAVEVSASLPGHPFSDGAPTKEDYLRWFGQIGEMGANAVQADYLMDADFYNALWEYNTSGCEPLWFIQCLSVSDDANYGRHDAYHPDFLDSIIRDGKAAVDIIHGRRNIAVGTSGAVGYYRRDVSQWTLGYIIGYEWSADIVAYTDNGSAGTGSYRGKYISASDDAGRFESMLAQAMDAVVSYESSKYKEQRLISFANSPSTDPFEYETEYARLLNKFCSIDGEHLTADGFDGLFMSYRLYGYCDDPLGKLSEAQLGELGGIADAVDRTSLYGGYMELLQLYHTRPVYIMSCGFSTGRAPTVEGQAPLTEEEQGRELVNVWRESVRLGFSGLCISSWQDSWERRSWNTAFASKLTRSSDWHDLQSEAQNFGLLDFSPGETPVCVLDGRADEWNGETPTVENDGLSLCVRYDAEGLYLLIRGPELDGRAVYLPIDVTDRSGSFVSEEPGLSFERASDFLLVLDGRYNTRLLVHERYDAFLENFGEEALGTNPFFSPPAKDSPVFVPSRAAVSKRDLPDVSGAERGLPELLGACETGRLVCGVGDPESDSYNSLADFCFGDGCVEVRIPWLLLNVSSPSETEVHRDYYEEYGVFGETVDGIWIGVGDGSGEIPMSHFGLDGWDKVVYSERLKRSYAVVQRAWREAEG